MARHYDDDDDMGDCDLKSMRQVYGALLREGASTEDLASAYEDLGPAKGGTDEDAPFIW